MALFDRNNNNRGYGYGPDQNRGGGFMDRAQNAVRRGWDRVENTFEGQDVGNDHLRQDYENRSTMDTGAGYGGGINRGWNAGGTGYNNNVNRPMDRDGGLHQRNSWSDGAWTADAGERADREWNTANRGRMDYDRDMNDTSPFQAGWRAGGMHGGSTSNTNHMSGGTGMNRGGMDRDRGWNLGGGGMGEWGHTGNLAGGANRYDRGYSAGGGNRGGGFMDRAQNAVRRGWENVEDRFDRDDNDRHPGGGAMRGGSSWAGNYDREYRGGSDLRGYRDSEGNYGVTHMGGMNRYGSAYRGGGMDMDRGDYDRGYKTREQTDAGDPFGDRANHTPIRMTNGSMGNRGNLGRYDENYRGNNREWF